MTFEQSTRIRKHLGRVGALIFVLFFVALLDSCVVRFREPLFTVHLLPGGSEPVDGRVDEELKDLSLLRVETSGKGVQLKIERFQTGHWLGGNMWTGAVSAATDAAAGDYDLRVYAPNQPPDAPVAAFRAVVYADYAALRESFLSVIRRVFDVAPGMVALICVPALGLVLGLVYLLGRGEERLLARQGRAEVFLLKPVPDGVEVYFGLGERHGVAPGMSVGISSQNGQPICRAVVRKVDADNAMALAVEGAERLRKGSLVSLPSGVGKGVA